jgi:hypothetical protein
MSIEILKNSQYIIIIMLASMVLLDIIMESQASDYHLNKRKKHGQLVATQMKALDEGDVEGQNP